MKNLICATVLCCTAATCAQAKETIDKTYWVTIGQDAMPELLWAGGTPFAVPSALSADNTGIAIAQINESQLNRLSRAMHHHHHRCGGYIVHDTLQEAMLGVERGVQGHSFDTTSQLSQSATVERLLPKLNKTNIIDTIEYLSTSFNNRFYSTSGGEAASNGLKQRWQNIVGNTPWADVTQVNHPNWRQKSVLVTLTGSEKPDEIIVIGGHLDSTIGFSTGENSKAPGADDDASGIATLTEVMRVFVEDGIQPKRTVKFYAYAAEEVGLRGSNEIAQNHQSQGLNVVGVLQLDMTGYKTSSTDISLISDYTSSSQNSYLANLLDTYLPDIIYTYSQCGYACSDHASWNNAGFPASFPFEATMGSSNPNIHTTGDTLERMDSSGNHSLNFAQLGLVYLVEMAAGSDTIDPNVLENKVPVTNLAASQGNDIQYTMDVPAQARNITFTISGGSGDADLYTRFGAVPTDNNYDCRPYIGGNNETCSGTNTDGTYHVRIKAYSTFSGVTLTGSFDEGDVPIDIDVTKTDISVAQGDWQRYTQQLQHSYGSFIVTMSGGSGDADLYVTHSSQSTDANYDCRPYKYGNNETCTLTSPALGTVHIDVKGYSAASGITLNWKTTP